MQPENESGSSRPTRRRAVVTTLGAGLIGTSAANSGTLLNDAGKQPESVTQLTDAECRMLEALGDTLLPGAAAAGIARYVNDQLGRQTPLLFLSYMDYPGLYADFYKDGLKALDHQSRTRYDQPFTGLDSGQKTALVRDLSQKTPADWEGPPSTLFYFVTRNDAVDVYYGTPQGFEKLGVPYLALIQPPANW